MGRILVADDEDVVVTLIRRSLEKEGHEVFSTSDGHEALKAALNQEFDLYVFDVRMPRLDGYSLCNSIRTKFPGRPVVLVTALPQEKYSAMAQAAGASATIAKPFDGPEFMGRIAPFLPKG